ncbi:MAG: hypothetical protein ACR2MF_04395, partial [Chthoniobacterales bacterium]
MAYGLRTSLIALSGVGVFIYLLPREKLLATTAHALSMGRAISAYKHRRPKTVWLLVWCVGSMPMLYLTYLVRHYGV